jgi:hypothetical protein
MLTTIDTDRVIEMTWEDRTPFENHRNTVYNERKRCN